MREKTRKHLRATLAATCALSLAASLAFPLAALAQASGPDEATQLPTTDTPVSDTPVADPAVADPAVAEPATEEAITAPAPAEPIAAAEPPSTNTPTEEPASTEMSSDAPASVTRQATDEPTGQTVSAATDNPADHAATVNEKTNLPTRADDLVMGEAWIRMSVNSPTGSYLASSSLHIPWGTTIAEARASLSETSVERDSVMFFYQLGTDAEISVGDRYPSCPGYTFQGWVNQSTGEHVTEDTPQDSSSVELIPSWRKDGSNIDFVSRWRVHVTQYMVADVSSSGLLSGPNVPTGADIFLDADCCPMDEQNDCKAMRERMINAGVESKNTFVADISLLVDGKTIHDGFGTMTLTFYPSATRELVDGDTLRIWHKHQDGSITYEDAQLVDGAASIEVTDLSLFGVGVLGKDVAPDDQKPGGNQGTQQPGDNGGNAGGNNDNGDKKDDGNKNDNGDKKTDDGKQGGSGDKGSNNKNSGNLAKTGDEMRYALGGTMAALTIALFTGGTALLMGNRKRPAHRRR